MPTYEYKCTICEERFEVEQSFKDNALTRIGGADEVHPKNKHTVKKVFHAPSIAFKGDGFYKNDSRKGSAPKSESSNESAPSTTDASPKTETKSSDPKPETTKNGTADTGPSKPDTKTDSAPSKPTNSKPSNSKPGSSKPNSSKPGSSKHSSSKPRVKAGTD